MVEAQRATSGRPDEVSWLVSGHGKEMVHGLAGMLCLAIRLADATQHGLAAATPGACDESEEELRWGN